MSQPIAVIGAGVIGLSSAITLAQAGHAVQIFAREFTPDTTSDRAAAYFAPLAGLGSPQLKPIVVDSWKKVTEFSRDASYGIRALPMYELFQHPEIPEQAADLPGYKDLCGMFGHPWKFGFTFDGFQFDIPTYMPRLMQEAKRAGVQIESREVRQLSELSDLCEVVINCSGLGACKLGDPSVYPIRGQVIRTSRPKDFPDIVISAETNKQITYVVPRLNDIILGGVYEHNNDDLGVDQATADSIWSRCLELRPELAQAEILEHRTGLRPGRSSPRVERNSQGNLTIIHNYGHGSTGHTLAWGCAKRVLELLETG